MTLYTYKTFSLLIYFYFWPSMQADVKRFAERCKLCRHAKGRSQDTCLHHRSPILGRLWNFVGVDFVLGFLELK